MVEFSQPDYNDVSNTTITPFAGLPDRTVHVPSGSVGAGVILGDVLLRLPLDEFWPGVHLAPYVFGGFGGIFVGSGPSAKESDEEELFASKFKGRKFRIPEEDPPGPSAHKFHVQIGIVPKSNRNFR
jgi:hypothetical protein